jgi:hypothetical protein
VRKPHLDLLALTSRRLEALSASERPGDVPGVLMYVARDLARWFFWTALRFERAYIAVELARTIQKRLALVHGAARSEPLSTRAVVDVAGRIISKVAARTRMDFQSLGRRLRPAPGNIAQISFFCVATGKSIDCRLRCVLRFHQELAIRDH